LESAVITLLARFDYAVAAAWRHRHVLAAFIREAEIGCAQVLVVAVDL